MNDNHFPHLDFVRTFWVSFILTVVVGPGLERPFFGDILAIYVELRAKRLCNWWHPSPIIFHAPSHKPQEKVPSTSQSLS